ncbi:MAG: hypothetical protein EP298_07910 [Gammaproteobacteria bacterium]|nr:MAG: hypothetical protein EP298_07910 [Gammaproteobacteria bacterium]UTW43642.1 hypothetical protein KFE69_06010 [bacterium SCSIO 12844]
METIKENNLTSFPKSKQIHHYISLNNKQLRILSKIYDDLTYNVAIEVLKYRKFHLNILWLSKLLNANPFDIKKCLSTLAKLSLIQFDKTHIRIR